MRSVCRIFCVAYVGNPTIPTAENIVLAGAGQPAAEAFMKFLKGDKAQSIIKSFGYELS
jgi:ABC-type molybdate transport system substrate-binding protein